MNAGLIPRRGDIYYVDFNPTVGSEQSGVRPAVIVSNDRANEHSSVVIVAALTTKPSRNPLPWDVQLPEGEPLARAGRIMCNQIRTIDKARLRTFEAGLSPAQLAQLDLALKVSLNLR